MKFRNSNLATFLFLGLATSGCVESEDPTPMLEESPEPETYPVSACDVDDSRPIRPESSAIPASFQSGDYIYRGPSDTSAGDSLFRFEDTSGSVFEIPFAWSPALIAGQSYNISGDGYGFTVSEGDRFIAYFGSTAPFPRAIKTPFEIADGIALRLLLECDRIAPWDRFCSDGYTEYLNLEVDGSGAYGEGTHSLQIDGDDYTLRIESLMNWHPFVPGESGCTPSGSHSLRFVLESQHP